MTETEGFESVSRPCKNVWARDGSSSVDSGAKRERSAPSWPVRYRFPSRSLTSADSNVRSRKGSIFGAARGLGGGISQGFALCNHEFVKRAALVQKGKKRSALITRQLGKTFEELLVNRQQILGCWYKAELIGDLENELDRLPKYVA